MSQSDSSPDKSVRNSILEALARGYCTKENEKKELDAMLCSAMADEVMQVLATRSASEAHRPETRPHGWSAWLIERSVGNTPEWWTGRQEEFTLHAVKAMHFARKQDAERALEPYFLRGRTAWFVSEHIFYDAHVAEERQT